jgi:hypothetical protein
VLFSPSKGGGRGVFVALKRSPFVVTLGEEKKHQLVEILIVENYISLTGKKISMHI